MILTIRLRISSRIDQRSIYQISYVYTITDHHIIKYEVFILSTADSSRVCIATSDEV